MMLARIDDPAGELRKGEGGPRRGREAPAGAESQASQAAGLHETNGLRISVVIPGAAQRAAVRRRPGIQ